MPRFHFQLDPLLRQRRREERDEQIALAALERERAELESQAQRLTNAAESAKDALRQSLDPGRRTQHHPDQPANADPAEPSAAKTRSIDPTAARWQATAAGAADARARQLAIKLAGVLKRRDEQRQRLARAATRRRAVESLREQRLEAFNREQRKRETAELDDTNNARAAAQATNEVTGS